jgi:glyoxylase-like metal-dependent hydrolase (beta-lactamase superfamily II)
MAVVDRLMLGNVEIARVTEWEGAGGAATDMFPDSARDEWHANSSWLAPDNFDPAAESYLTCMQTWVLRSEGATILIDTGVGNHKDRPAIPPFSGLETDFVERLKQAGTTPDDVDVVVCTHTHVDHVGWNTILDNGEWRPTFPNATYLFAERDYDFWNPDNAHQRRGEAVNANMFDDSVRPIRNAGQAHLWDGSHRIDANLRIALAPGHTPGLGVVTLESGGDRAVFVGDLLHSPMQVLHPEWNSCFCESPEEARASRERVLSWAADNNALVVPAHVGGDHAFEVRRDGSAFAITRWATYS